MPEPRSPSRFGFLHSVVSDTRAQVRPRNPAAPAGTLTHLWAEREAPLTATAAPPPYSDGNALPLTENSSPEPEARPQPAAPPRPGVTLHETATSRPTGLAPSIAEPGPASPVPERAADTSRPHPQPAPRPASPQVSSTGTARSAAPAHVGEGATAYRSPNAVTHDIPRPSNVRTPGTLADAASRPATPAAPPPQPPDDRARASQSDPAPSGLPLQQDPPDLRPEPARREDSPRPGFRFARLDDLMPSPAPAWQAQHRPGQPARPTPDVEIGTIDVTVLAAEPPAKPDRPDRPRASGPRIRPESLHYLRRF